MKFVTDTRSSCVVAQAIVSDRPHRGAGGKIDKKSSNNKYFKPYLFEKFYITYSAISVTALYAA